MNDKNIRLSKETVYNEIVDGKRVKEIADKYGVSTIKVNYHKNQLAKDGKLVFHRGVRPVPKDLDDRESFWLNRVRSWRVDSVEQEKERGRVVAQIKARSTWFNDVTTERRRRVQA